jgi:hypothetical protein
MSTEFPRMGSSAQQRTTFRGAKIDRPLAQRAAWNIGRSADRFNFSHISASTKSAPLANGQMQAEC